MPVLNSVHISTGAKPKTEPTERSNSPAVISSVIASAMRPSSTVKVRVLETLSGERKRRVDRGEEDELGHEQHQRAELGHGDEALEAASVFPRGYSSGERGAGAGPRPSRQGVRPDHLPDRMSS